MDKLKELLLELLKFIGESPFRLFTVILLCFLGFGGWILYSEKDAFMASYRAQQAMPKMNGKYEEAVNFILKNKKDKFAGGFSIAEIQFLAVCPPAHEIEMLLRPVVEERHCLATDL